MSERLASAKMTCFTAALLLLQYLILEVVDTLDVGAVGERENDGTIAVQHFALPVGAHSGEKGLEELFLFHMRLS